MTDHWFHTAPVIPPKPWMREKHMELVTIDTLRSVVDRCIQSGKYAHDLETTGLDNRVFDGRTIDQIVGHCLSPDGKSGYYVPVRHTKSAHLNLPVTLVEEEMRRLGDSSAVAVFFNAPFDQEFLAYPGTQPLGSKWDEIAKWEDAALDAYLFNPRDKNRNLKDLSAQHLGMEMIELKELFPKDHVGKKNFAELDPSDDAVLWYACSDAICTYLLLEWLRPRIEGQESALLIEKLCVPATRWMERNRILISKEKVEELIRLGQGEYYDALTEVYDACQQKLARDIEPGWMKHLRRTFDRNDPSFDIQAQIDDAKKQAKLRKGLDDDGDIPVHKAVHGVMETFPGTYDILSRQQLGRLLEELGVPGLTKTEKSKQVETTADVIEELAKEYGHAFPFLPLISRMGELQKALGTYLISLRDDVGPDGTIRVRYRQTGTDTGRFTTPASRDPSEDGGTKYPMHGTPATYDKTRPKCLLKIREAIIPRPGGVIVAVDFSGVELRIATNLTGEPKWLREFFRCSTCGTEFDQGNGTDTPMPPPAYCPTCGDDRIGDLHTLTALVFYGETVMQDPKIAKDRRQKAKTANFASVFGGGPRALQAATGCDEMEAARQYDNFGKTYSVLSSWWRTTRARGEQQGYVTTCFGRRYPVPDLSLPIKEKDCPNGMQRVENKRLRSKAERNATNAPIQGSSADITKLAMGRIYIEFKKRGWLDKARMLITMHDELVFDVDLDIVGEATRVIPEVMTRNKGVLSLKWRVPLTSDVEIGYDYTVPLNVKNFAARRVRSDGVELNAKGEPNGSVWPKEFVEVFGPLYGFADDAQAPELPPLQAPKPQARVHLIEVEELKVGLIEHLAQFLIRVQNTGDHRLEVRLKNGPSLLWPGAKIMVDPAKCTFDPVT